MAGRKKKSESSDSTGPGSRGARGRVRDEASFPVAPGRDALPSDYVEVLNEIKRRIQEERLRVVLAANSAMVALYWDIGQLILARQEEEGWGARVIDRLSHDLSEAYPEMKGFSSRNLLFMRSMAAAYPDRQKVKQLVSQLPWGHIIRLLQRVKDPEVREWYMRKSAEEGWSRSVLEIQVDRQLHLREGKALSNFPATLPPADSDMAGQVFKDPYLFDFLGTADPRREREVEQALVDHIQRFLLELGSGFAFVGRQVHLEFKTRDCYIDLLFYHLTLRSYVIIELKAVPFDPGFVGQLNMYLSAVDDLLRHPDDKPTIGLLLCRSRDRIVVEYALRDVRKPIGVSEWETTLVEKLPEELRGSLPTVEEIEAELEGTEPPNRAMGPDAATEPGRHQVRTKMALSQQQMVVLQSAERAKPLIELLELCGRSDRTKFRNDVLEPLVETGWLEMTIPDKPSSWKQRYRTTTAGLRTLDESEK